MVLKGSVLMGFLAYVAAGVAVSQNAIASLIISDSAIDSSTKKYNYTLSYSDLGGSKWADDITSSVNMARTNEPYSPSFSHYIQAVANSSQAEFVYTFDFRNTAYRAASASFYDIIRIFNNNVNSAETATITTAYSTDGINYFTLNTASTLASNVAANGNDNKTSSGTHTTGDLSGAGVVYYKVMMVAADGSALLAAQNQWGRVAANGSSTAFSASFNMVPAPIPEAATLGILSLGIGLMLARKSR